MTAAQFSAAFEEHALWPSTGIPAPKFTPSVICCEREATEPEGAGHDWDCPTHG